VRRVLAVKNGLNNVFMKRNKFLLSVGLAFIVLTMFTLSCNKEVTPPIAEFDASPDPGTAGSPVTFTIGEASAGGCEECEVYEYLWNFGEDDTTWLVTEGTSNSMLHTYSSPGDYTVTLRVRNTQGQLSDDIVKQLTISTSGGGGTGTGTGGNAPTTPTPIVPLNDASNVSVNPTLQWNASYDPDGDELTYDVYIGSTNPPALQVSKLKITSYSPQELDESTYYYWKIVVNDGTNEVISPVWSFSTEGSGSLPNRPPNAPVNPYPASGALNQSIGKYLTWSASDPDGDNLVYDVYFGVEAATDLVAEGIYQNYYDPGLDLSIGTNYHWRVVASDGQDETTSETWSFQTAITEFYCSDEFTDNRDGTTYKSVKIGNQCWMAENLRYGTFIESNLPNDNQSDDGSYEYYAYNNNESNVDQFGGLYQWGEIMNYNEYPESRGLCPEGWHMPSEDEWNQLVIYLGGNAVAGDHLIADGSTGFEAVFAGERNNESGSFSSFGQKAGFWSSTNKDASEAFGVYINDGFSGAYFEFDSRQVGKSVRCIRD
jgi:uncharacterized protein (TIGR02145 family)